MAKTKILIWNRSLFIEILHENQFGFVIFFKIIILPLMWGHMLHTIPGGHNQN